MSRFVSRLNILKYHLSTPTKGFSSSTTFNEMTHLSIDSKYKLASGYEIPVLGFGVSVAIWPFLNMRKGNKTTKNL